jgi:hypothetical protein
MVSLNFLARCSIVLVRDVITVLLSWNGCWLRKEGGILPLELELGCERKGMKARYWKLGTRARCFWYSIGFGHCTMRMVLSKRKMLV